jgi:replicative DNA helicase
LIISDLLIDQDFYNESNSVIFSVMLDLYKNSKPIDIITVKEKLDDKKVLDKV